MSCFKCTDRHPVQCHDHPEADVFSDENKDSDAESEESGMKLKFEKQKMKVGGHFRLS